MPRLCERVAGQIANDCIWPDRRLTFASDLDFPAPAAFLALAAAATGSTGKFIRDSAGHGGEILSREPSDAMAEWASPVTWRITIEAHMGGHVAPPTSFGDCARVSIQCQTKYVGLIGSYQNRFVQEVKTSALTSCVSESPRQFSSLGTSTFN